MSCIAPTTTELFGPVPVPSVVTAGLWECDLTTEALTWSDGIYALFGLDPGTPLDRRRIVECYDRESRVALECLRLAAIRDRTGFLLDARIRAADGADRWIRIVARVRGETTAGPKLFGAKYDLTEERQLWGMRMASPQPVTDA